MRDGTSEVVIHEQISGESGGLTLSPTLGGDLHWQIAAYAPEGRAPTYGAPHVTILHYALACYRRVTRTPRVKSILGDAAGNILTGGGGGNRLSGAGGDDCLQGGGQRDVRTTS